MDILKKRRSAACKCSVAADVSYKEAGVQQGRILKILKVCLSYNPGGRDASAVSLLRKMLQKSHISHLLVIAKEGRFFSVGEEVL